jgi:hypothetical protein
MYVNAFEIRLILSHYKAKRNNCFVFFVFGNEMLCKFELNYAFKLMHVLSIKLCVLNHSVIF